MTFEQSINRLKEIVSLLERDSQDLDKSLQLFEEGTAIIKDCNLKLDMAEQKVTMLCDSEEKPFND